MPGSNTRDMAALRREIIKEIWQHPLTLMPLGTAVVCAVWATAFQPAPANIIGMVGGVTVGVLGGLYNLFFRGEIIRDRIVEKWEARDREEVTARRMALRQSLRMARGSDDIVAVFDDFEALRTTLTDALRRSDLSELRRVEFELLAEQNYTEAMNMFESLAFLQKQLTQLLETASARATESDAVRRLREERLELLDQIRALLSALDKIWQALPALGADAVEESQRELDRLQASVELARSAQARLDAELNAGTPENRPRSFE